jgi:sterol desaturase/sphingolipid hydroxylase (fatty acid hydroxylase superfamily)
MDFIELLNLERLLLLCLIFVPLERVLGLRRDQRILRRGYGTDLVYLLLNNLVIRVGLMAAIVVAIQVGDWAVPAAVKGIVGGQPLWVQLLEIFVIADLGFYAVHRAFHVVPRLWRFHSIHHGIEELDWLAGARVHAVDQILTKGVSLVPLVVLGFSWTAIALFSATYFWHSVLLHANVRLSFGPLRWLIASPGFHHWHHGRDAEARDKNFAGQLSILDVLFGTFHMPADRMPSSYGIEDPVPAGYFAQLLYPLLPKR